MAISSNEKSFVIYWSTSDNIFLIIAWLIESLRVVNVYRSSILDSFCYYNLTWYFDYKIRNRYIAHHNLPYRAFLIATMRITSGYLSGWCSCSTTNPIDSAELGAYIYSLPQRYPKLWSGNWLFHHTCVHVLRWTVLEHRLYISNFLSHDVIENVDVLGSVL